LNENQLCGRNQYGGGTYTIEGITALCEGIKQSNIQSLSLLGNNVKKASKSALLAARPGLKLEV